MNQRKQKRLADARAWGKWAALRIGAWLLAHLMPAAAPATLTSLARWQWSHETAARRGLLHNLGHVLQRPPADPAVVQTAQRAYRHLWLNYRDLFRGPRLDAAMLHDLVQIQGESVLQRLRQQDQAAILLGGHFAGGELALQALAARGWPALIAAERVQPPALFAWLCGVRGAHGHRFAASDTVLMPMARTLRQGGLVGLMMDRDTTGSGQAVTICGATARLPVGALRLSMRWRAPLIPISAQRLPAGRVELTIHEPLVWAPAADDEETLTNGLTAMGAQLERIITWQPDQWVLTTPLWEALERDALRSSHPTISPYQAGSPSM
jgi:KDO2-lipid IV(A) lauroyltransferase